MTQTLSPAAMRARANSFASEFADASYEMGQAQQFIHGLLGVFGISRLRAVSFEERVKKVGGARGRIDGFLPGRLLIEMKSKGKDADDAYQQALGYLPGLPDAELPTHILVSDFAELHLYNRVTKEVTKCKLTDLADNLDAYKFLAGYESTAQKEQIDLNQQAAEILSDLHDVMRSNDYRGKPLETYLMRLLFCLFADDSNMFHENGAFENLVVNHSRDDGSDLDDLLQRLFKVLDTEENIRPKSTREILSPFPHVNGKLFADDLPRCDFDENGRKALLACSGFNWSQISPDIFGSLFQSVMHHEDEARTAKTAKRREFGAHYTSPENIQKVIGPLFLDELKSERSKARGKPKALRALQDKISQLQFFDPACGCGNFLVIAYQELRQLELDIVLELQGKGPKTQTLDIHEMGVIRCNITQFHGIEIDEAAAQIATLALWLTDHLENLRAGKALGGWLINLPLTTKANIVCGNALEVEWATVIPPENCSYILGNPPFIGHSNQSRQQKVEIENILIGVKGAGLLDYVAGWYVLAMKYMNINPNVEAALVSTNSITQGEQVGILWSHLLRMGLNINFAHRTFRWSNDGRGVAAVHCIIVGFSMLKKEHCKLFEYENSEADPIESSVRHINPYLTDAPDVLLQGNTKPVDSRAPRMINGSKPTEGGNLFLNFDEYDEVKNSDPIAAKYVRKFLGAEEFINNIPRFCLWLIDSTAQERKLSPEISKRMKKIIDMRSSSTDAQTRKDAETPYLFQKIRQTSRPYLLVPRHSSENRRFIPMGYFEPDVICGDANSMIPDATLYHFGVLSSTMHNAWVRATCGRIKSDFRYSNTIVYNNYPWPASITDSQHAAIEKAANAVLEARELEMQRAAKQGQHASLAAMYDEGNMPVELLQAHRSLDLAVDAAYVADGYSKGKTSDAARVSFLFGRYQALTSMPIVNKPTKKPAAKKVSVKIPVRKKSTPK